MMSVNDDEQNVKIYMKKMANNTNEYVILVEESDEVLVVLMNGTLTLDEAAKAVKVGDKRENNDFLVDDNHRGSSLVICL